MKHIIEKWLKDNTISFSYSKYMNRLVIGRYSTNKDKNDFGSYEWLISKLSSDLIAHIENSKSDH